MKNKHGDVKTHKNGKYCIDNRINDLKKYYAILLSAGPRNFVCENTIIQPCNK